MKVDSKTFFELMAAATYVFGDGAEVDIPEVCDYIRQEAERRRREEEASADSAS